MFLLVELELLLWKPLWQFVKMRVCLLGHVKNGNTCSDLCARKSKSKSNASSPSGDYDRSLGQGEEIENRTMQESVWVTAEGLFLLDCMAVHCLWLEKRNVQRCVWTEGGIVPRSAKECECRRWKIEMWWFILRVPVAYLLS